MAKKTTLPSKAPKGLKVVRNGNTFTFSWTAGEAYKDVDLKVRVGTGKKNKKGKTYIEFDYKAGAKDLAANKVSITFPYTYRKATKKVKAGVANPKTFVHFTCRGLAKRKLTKKEKDKYSALGESAWCKSWGKFNIELPSRPSMSATWDSSTDNKTTFSWSVANADKANKKWFTGHRWRVGWQAQDVKKGKITWGRWMSRTDAKYSWSTPESNLGQYKSFIRHVQAYSLGKRGISKRISKKHIYAKPYEPKDLKFKSFANVAGGIVVHFQWKHVASGWHPIDYTEVQYAVSPPAKGMSSPWNLSGTKISQLASKKPTKEYVDSEVQELAMRLNENECLFCRVRFVHDNEENFSNWIRCTIYVPKLSAPSTPSLTPLSDNIINVSATNTADEVEDSFLLIAYKSIDAAGKQSTVRYIGIIPHGSDSLDVRLPDDVGAANMQVIGIRAIAYAFTNKDFKVIDVKGMIDKMSGSSQAEKISKVFNLIKSDLYIRTNTGTAKKPKYVYTKVTSQEYSESATYCAHLKLAVGTTQTGKPYKTYSFPSLTNKNSMKSDWIWEDGEFPKPPTNFTVVSSSQNTTEADTAVASWDWNWTEATAIELAWANHSDAWESTDEPTTYRVPVNRATQWNIKGLSAGTIWYFRARFIREVGETETVGPWSTMVDLNLTSAPVAPVLMLSRNVVTEDQDFVASWVYTSTDGSPQELAEIFLTTVDANGTRRGTYKPAVDLLPKDETVDPPVTIFDADRTYYTLSEGVYTVVASPVAADVESYYLFDDASALAQTETGSTAQQITLNPTDLGLKLGDVYQLSLRLKSKSGAISEWSPMVELEIVEPLEPPVISSIAELAPEVVTDYVSGDVYSITSDVTVSSDKSYYTLIGTEVEEPDTEEIDNYYEKSGEVYSKTTDTVVVVGKAYYTVDATPVFEPKDEELGTYYELPVTEVYRSYLALHALPINLNVTGSGDQGTTMVTIERTVDFFTDKPDETIDRGYMGEIVALIRQTGEAAITIDKDSLMGDLDDSAMYKLNVSIVDVNGQTASEEHSRATVSSAEDFVRWRSILFTRSEERPYEYFPVGEEDTYDSTVQYYYPNEFTVSWDHQPAVPTATCEIDNERYAAKITAGIPDGYTPRQDDTIDIYRLSVDKPQLIVENGLVGQTYVDPYPAFGEFGGHRVVYKTVYGDYIADTEDGRLFSWVDLGADDGDTIETPFNVFNFSEGKVEVLYNIDLSSSWKKDFKETKYLGGHVQGDWTPGVTRTGSLNTVSVITQDQETIKQMRRLADYAGIVHVRTRDGSSFAANVDVSETMNHDSWELASYSLSFTRVDSEGLDGMTLEEWNKLIAKENS